ncbi:MAG: biotin carboxylase N-terminal domain-containing protein [Chloroflexota bacterium]|nr:biotin carboxylase N-terminal domain-containing protein [Chloroflexota bacterium]
MFTKILIANRGEIACRIIKTCNKLGIRTVAIYSEADQKAKHVKLADEAYLLGDSDPSQSYLNIEKIVKIAETNSVDAVHPGYGFLSENPDFAQRCSEAGICFIGPDAGTIAKMGDKLTARKLAKNAGLPVLPGSGVQVSDSDAVDEAWKLGFPMMVKPADGGGGIGIHTINSIDELLPIVDRTRLVSQNAFGSTRLFFERYLAEASHIEVQIIGDEHGNLIHLHERDCSLQRRNQKVIEETPATKLPDKVRNKLHKLAVKLGKHINYTNVGTVEFLVSDQGQIYFLEMNTRLQVEHGVTEMVTGLDLVEMQIRVACGEAIEFNQDQISVKGHAIEARVYPEDPDTFMPNVGVVSGLHMPRCRLSRIDTALCKGYEVTLHYEPLLAKVMAWGKNRDESIKRLQKVLLGIRVDGIKTNIPLLKSLLSGASFNYSTHHTGSVSQIIEKRKQETNHPTLSGSMDKSEQLNKKTAATIGVALAMALHQSKSHSPSNPEESPWRTIARSEQLLSRNSGQIGWH